MFDDSPDHSSSSSPSRKSINSSGIVSRLPMIVAVVLLFVAVGAAGFFFIQYQNEKTRAAQLLGASTQSPEEIKKLLEKVGKLIELPQGESPTVASVTDPKTLASQAFFEKAQAGDQVLIFDKSRVAVLYRPSTGKIINYATNITVGNNETTPAQSEEGDLSPTPTDEPTPTPTVPAQTTSAPTVEPTVAPAQ